MTLRTPRRRISPRTRRRYRAIKGFLKRAIGNSSQPDIKINSSIAVNVTDLNRKIVGLEQQMSEVSRTCREFINLDTSRRETQSIIASEIKDDPQKDDFTGKELQGVETKILYRTAESQYRKTVRSDYDGNQNKRMNFNTTTNERMKKRSGADTGFKDMNQKFRRHQSESIPDSIVSSYSTVDFNSLTEQRAGRQLNPGFSGIQADRRAHKKEKSVYGHQTDEIHNKQIKRVQTRNNEQHCVEKSVKHSKNRKSKHGSNELDQDFIADIVKRQYNPVKMFSRRDSDLSQFTAPMCRDREFTLNEDIQENADLCSCCYGSRHSPKPNINTRSVCDARLYSSKKIPKYRRVYADTYNDSELYDLIPVKEKSSPKARKKFFQDNWANIHGYKEVPPSPKTRRPRLNLKAQYYTEPDYHTDLDAVRYDKRRVSPKRHNRYQEPSETFDTDQSSLIMNTTKNKHKQLSKQEQIHHEMGTMSSLEYPHHFDIEVNNNTVALDKTQETVSSTEKTDRALCEIKDILQTFLQEIKKEASSSGKSNASNKTKENCVCDTSPKGNASTMNHSGHSFSAPQCSSAPAAYVPPYPNACCYPVLPIYPINCMQNSFSMPNQSYTCCCADKTEDPTNNKNKAASNEIFTSETDELIKEIYKYVAQSPIFSRKQYDIVEDQTRNSFENRVSRSIGESNHVSKHDAKTGTTKMKCYSKSCEAIGPKSDTYFSGTNGSYSDTILKNQCLEASATSSETELRNERDKYKAKNSRPGKLRKVLRSFGLFKKKYNGAIEELSETESTIDVKIEKKPAFRQEVANYMMHSQEYYRPPPVPQNYKYNYPQDYRSPYNPAMQNFLPPPAKDSYYDPRVQQSYELSPSQAHPSAPPYANAYDSYNQMPQVPLWLKEIEVKSMATQSERKMSFFRKIKQKIQPTEQTNHVGPSGARTFATQTTQNKPSLWKSLQSKAMEGRDDSMAFSYKQQQKLATGDAKMRNVMLKKMFNKRNPFSSRNLIVRTLLGKDKPSFGEPLAMYRPRMFT